VMEASAELRTRGDAKSLLSPDEEEGGDLIELGAFFEPHAPRGDDGRDSEDGGGDLLRDIDSKRKRNVAELYYYYTQRKVVTGVLVGLALILLVLLSLMVGYRMGASDHSGSTASGSSSRLQELRQMAVGVLSAMNRSVDPCTDFYQFACGTWLSDTVLPADKSRYARSFSRVADENLIIIRSILEDDWPVLSTLYRACMDNDTLNSLGDEPLKPSLKRIGEIADNSGLAAELAQLSLEGMSLILGFGSRTDPSMPNVTIGFISQSGLGMPDRSYYLGNDSTSVALRGNYTQHMKNLFQLLKGVDSPSLDPSTVLEVETKLAQIFVPRTDLRDPYKTNSMRTLGEIKQMVQQFDWDIYFNILRSDVDNDVLTQGRINVYTMSYFEHLGQLLNSVSLEDWKTYLAWHLVSSNAYLLSSEFREENERWGKILTGQNQGSPRWKQCTSLTQNLLGFIVGHHFVQAHFSNGSKEVALELVRNIKSTFSESITKLDWMDDETKQQAITKLNKIENMIGTFSLGHNHYHSDQQ